MKSTPTPPPTEGMSGADTLTDGVPVTRFVATPPNASVGDKPPAP
jgi:hypothetical protein